MRRATVLFVTVPVLWWLLSCSGRIPDQSDEDAAAGSRPFSRAVIDACAILTVEDVRELYGPGMEATAGEAPSVGSAATVSSCLYFKSAPPEATVVLVLRTTRAEKDPSGALKRYVAEVRRMIGEELQVERIRDLGVATVWNPASENLVAFEGSTMVSLDVDAAPGRDKKVTARLLMGKALVRLREYGGQ